MRRIHFIGIGGVGMNGLAQLAAQSGYEVTGSDRAHDASSELFRCLHGLGVTMFPQDGSGISGDTAEVVFSTAIESDNADFQKAESLGIPLLHRADFLNELIGDAPLIAVAGTSGKTTTTGMLGWIFECLGKDPTVYNGAAVLNWKTKERPGNVRKGNSDLWIIEADESDRSFLTFHPIHSIITNISKDHYELDELHTMFDRFERQTSGTVIRGPIESDSALHVAMPGSHNRENARCAAELCFRLGMEIEPVAEAMAGFKGIERRLEITGCVEGITIIDDYAHNPAKIGAALAAVAESHATVHAYWRPHGFKALHQCMDELTATFTSHWNAHGGSLCILPVYYAGGTVERKTTSADLVDRLNSTGVPAELVVDYADLRKRLEQRAREGDAILGMGARDPQLPIFAKQLASEWKNS
ncbi:MAG: hypothetical protein KJN98_08720 [Pontiella sp.]|nr:hypothetical protein [Pontiella sp.]